MAFDVGAVIGHLDLRKDQWNQSIAAAKGDMKSMRGLVMRNSAQIKQMGRAMTIAGGAIVGSLGLMVKSAVGFNKEMANVATLIPGQSERIIELKGNVQDLAMQYGKSTSDISGGLYQVISAFGDAADTAKKLEINVMAAAAGMATTTDAINLTSAVTKAYGDTSAKAVQKVADLAFLTVKLGQTTFPELAASIGMVTPQMEAMGVQQEELFAGFATLTGVTGNAAIVSTQFKGILNAMMKPSEFMAKAIEKLGFETSKAMVKELGMVGALRELIGTTDGTNEQIAKLFPNIRALPAVFALAGAQADTFDKKLEAMGDRTGTLEEAFNEMSRGINQAGFDMERLKQMTVVLAQRLGDKLAPMIGNIAVKVGETINKVTEWIKAHPKLTEIIAKSALAIGGLLTVLGPLMMMLPGLIAALPLIKAGFASLLGPLGAVTIAIAAVGAAINTLVNAYKKKQDAEIDAMVEASKSHSKFWELRKRLIAEEIVTVEEWKEIYDKHGRNYKRVMHAIAVLPEYEHIRKRWEEITEAQDAVDESGEDLAKTLKDEIAAALAEVGDEQKTWLDYLSELGLMTLQEKQDRIIELTGFLNEMHQSYRDGKLDIDDYRTAVTALKDEITALSTKLVETALPASRDMTGVLEQGAAASKDYAGVQDVVAKAVEKRAVEELTMFEKISASTIIALGQSKLGAIAQATMSTYAGAAKTLELLGIPLAIPFMAIAIATGLGQVASIASVPIPSAEKGAYLPNPAIIEAGHGPLGEVVLPLDRAPIGFTKEGNVTTRSDINVDLNFYAPLISTVGLSERDMDRASEYMLEKMKREIERYGGKLNG